MRWNKKICQENEAVNSIVRRATSSECLLVAGIALLIGCVVLTLGQAASNEARSFNELIDEATLGIESRLNPDDAVQLQILERELRAKLIGRRIRSQIVVPAGQVAYYPSDKPNAPYNISVRYELDPGQVPPACWAILRRMQEYSDTKEARVLAWFSGVPMSCVSRSGSVWFATVEPDCDAATLAILNSVNSFAEMFGVVSVQFVPYCHTLWFNGVHEEDIEGWKNLERNGGMATCTATIQDVRFEKTMPMLYGTNAHQVVMSWKVDSVENWRVGGSPSEDFVRMYEMLKAH